MQRNSPTSSETIAPKATEMLCQYSLPLFQLLCYYMSHLAQCMPLGSTVLAHPDSEELFEVSQCLGGGGTSPLNEPSKKKFLFKLNFKSQLFFVFTASTASMGRDNKKCTSSGKAELMFLPPI